MPKIRIIETDKTGSVQASAISNVVFVPITAAAGTAGFEPTLFSSVNAFKEFIEEKVPVASGDSFIDTPRANIDHLDCCLCIHLLRLGFQVLVEGITAEEPSWQKLQDKGLYDIRFLTNGTQPQTAGIPAGMIECAKKRGDCVALVNADESDEFTYDITTVRSVFSGISDGEFAAGFTPWFYTNNSDFANVLDTSNQKVENPKIPAAFGYLFAYANAIKNYPEWYAIAGFERGIIPELTGVAHEYSSAEIEILQSRASTAAVELDDETDNVGVAINPIANIRPAGYIIYGNRTLRSNDATKKLIATSFLNVRNAVSAIKKVMYEASRKYTFEQNTETLWINFQSYVTPLLDNMKSGNGILGYKFIKVKTNAKARLKARLNIIPVEAVEDFDLEVYLTDDLTVSE